MIIRYAFYVARTTFVQSRSILNRMSYFREWKVPMDCVTGIELESDVFDEIDWMYSIGCFVLAVQGWDDGSKRISE